MIVGQRSLWGPAKSIGKFEPGIEFLKLTEFTSLCGYILKRSSIPKLLKLTIPMTVQLGKNTIQ
jgi:hypothetical protein